MPTDFVGAEHEFHSKTFALGWAERFVPTPERIRLFDLICSELEKTIPEHGHIVELGIGPGYLATHILERFPRVSYQGLDFSEPMLEIARNRLDRYSARVTYTPAELVEHAWEENLVSPVHAIVSTWALHDLGSPQAIKTVYERAHRALRPGGILLNGDFIQPAGARQEFEGGRFLVDQHLELLAEVGFAEATCLSLFEQELTSPTATKNYACLRAASVVLHSV